MKKNRLALPDSPLATDRDDGAFSHASRGFVYAYQEQYLGLPSHILA